MIFLIEYDRDAGKILELRKFSDRDRRYAQRERLARELELKRHGLIREIVLLEAQDQQALERTHRRYFKTAQELLERNLEESHPV
jgi:hypothetical protein